MKKVAFYTLGCKLNFAESSSIARSLEPMGFVRSEFQDQPDLFVINTCSVTEQADKKCKKVVREAKKVNPNSTVVIIGCYAQLKPKEIAEIPGVDLVLGAAEKFNLIEHIATLSKGDAAKICSCDIETVSGFNSSFSVNDRTRTFLKVQDGCDYSCSFCTIPKARGKSRSDSISNTMTTAKEVVKAGAREIVLTGVNIGDFGNGTDESFYDLIQALDALTGVDRIRISSIEPNLLTNKIIEFCASSNKIMPHFHIPLQSGSNKILSLMRRRYNRELYEERIHKIKDLLPNACIGADVIVGFPGETDENFLETYNYLNDLDISYLHVFTYSERPNTEAVLMDGVVAKKVRAKRSKMLRGLSVKKRRAFYESQIGNSSTVLFESENKEGYIHGFTENYVKVKTPWNPDLVNTLQQISLTKIDEDGLVRFDFISELISSSAT